MVEFRPAVLEDLSGILALYRELNPDDSECPSSKARDIWTEVLAHPRIAHFIAASSGRLVGTCHVVVVPNLTRSGRPYAVVENVVVANSHRRRGTGRALVHLAIEFARAQHCYKVMLLSSAKRTEAHGFYESVGFDGSSKRAFVLPLQS
jgi:GNAT superfamily N-acetyltransferase